MEKVYHDAILCTFLLFATTFIIQTLLFIEFIVDKLYLKTHDTLNVKITNKPPLTKAATTDHTFSYSFLVVTVLIAMIGIYGEGAIKEFINIEQYCHNLDLLLMQHNIITKPGVSLDAFIGVICWSTTYLFIRRLWNPETSDVAIQRFSADAFFGGLAAGGSVILKSMLVRILVEKK
jgi:hypothetical protein